MPERGWHTIEFPDGTVSDGAWDFGGSGVSKQLLVLDTVSVPLALLPSPLARIDARRDGGEKHRVGLRGGACAILARA